MSTSALDRKLPQTTYKFQEDAIGLSFSQFMRMLQMSQQNEPLYLKFIDTILIDQKYSPTHWYYTNLDSKFESKPVSKFKIKEIVHAFLLNLQSAQNGPLNNDSLMNLIQKYKDKAICFIISISHGPKKDIKKVVGKRIPLSIRDLCSLAAVICVQDSVQALQLYRVPSRKFYNVTYHVTTTASPFSRKSVFITSSGGFEADQDDAKFKFTLSTKSKLLSTTDAILKRLEESMEVMVIWSKLNFLIERNSEQIWFIGPSECRVKSQQQMVQFYSKIPGFSSIAKSPLFMRIPSPLPEVTASYDSLQLPSALHTPQVSPYAGSHRRMLKSKSEVKSLTTNTRSPYTSDSHSPFRNYNSQEKIGVIEIGSEWNSSNGVSGGPKPPKKLQSDDQ